MSLYNTLVASLPQTPLSIILTVYSGRRSYYQTYEI